MPTSAGNLPRPQEDARRRSAVEAYLAHRASPDETFLTFARRHDGETLRKLADAEASP
jgi:ferredoxin-nitrite reductase